MKNNKRKNKIKSSREDKRRVSNYATSKLKLKRYKVLEILDKHNVDKLCDENIGSWLENLDSAPDFFREIVELSERTEQKRKDNKTERELQRIIKEEKEKKLNEGLVDSIIEKYRLHKKNFSSVLTSKEKEHMEIELWYSCKDLAGSEPSLNNNYFSDYAKIVLEWAGVDIEDHTTFPVHMNGCDYQGKSSSCVDRINFLREERREADKYHRNLTSGLKEIEIMTKGLQVGDPVLCWWNSRIGIIRKVNKISYNVELICSYASSKELSRRRLHPSYVEKISLNDYPRFNVGDKIQVKMYDGHKREVVVLKKKDHFYFVEYEIKSKKEIRRSWIDPLTFIK